MFTKDFELPTEDELAVEEINISTPALRAAAFHLGKSCENENNEFMLCRHEEKDPRKCLDEGKAVTACSLNFFRAVKKTCASEFTQYARCLDQSSKNLAYNKCRNTQAVFDKCVLENLGMERPEFGYFCKPKILDTKRPKPEIDAPLEFPDAPAPLPDHSESESRTARYGTRYYWMN